MDKIVNIGIVGAGFGTSFYFHLHPNCKVKAVSAVLENDRILMQEIYSCNTTYATLDELIKDTSIDAVALFTPAHLHAEHSISCLKNGKHVLCAVPVGLTIEECFLVKKAVKETGLTYMMAETSYYRQDVISARQFFYNGDFGKLLSVKSEYLHPGLEEYFFDKNKKPTWRHGLPPMLYATHCTSFLTGINSERIKQVSCVGWGDDDAILNGNSFNNPYWNQSALFVGENNTSFEVNISWRGAFMANEGGSWHGDKMSFYTEDPKTNKSYLVKRTADKGFDDAGFPCQSSSIEEYNQQMWWTTEMLPEPLRINSGHFGSHTFLTHEFIESILQERKPSVSIELGINLTLPGIFANESSLKGSESLKVLNYDNL